MRKLRKAKPNNRKAKKVIPKLTVRQEQVLSLVAQGRTDKEISSMLEISMGTVSFHMGMIMERLQARSRAHAVAIRFVPVKRK